MKMKVLKSVIFCAICVALFFAVQHVLMRDWFDINNIHYSIKGFKEIDDDNLEAIFIGASSTQYGISPMKIYEDEKICSYNLATPGQPISCSYFLLREAFKQQSPSLVVLEATSLFFGDKGEEDDECWRYILDNLELSSNKIEMAEAYENVIPDADKWDALFPIIKYHRRWSEINTNDFRIDNPIDYYSAGQWILGTVLPSSFTLETINREKDYMLSQDHGDLQFIENGQSGSVTTDTPLYDPSISPYCEEYFLKIKQLCEDNGAQLMLVKIPHMYSPVLLARYSWTELNYQITKAFADKYGINYYDLSYDADPEIDFYTETFDGGIHLNIRGAEKATQALEEYLVANYDLKQNSYPIYDANLEKYHAVRDMAYLQSEMSFDKYMEILERNKDRWTILIAAKDNYVATSNPLDYDVFEKLGLQLISKGELWDSYVAVIDKGTVKYEGLSDRALYYSASLENINVSLTSLGWFSGRQTSPYASIYVNGQETAVNGEGLNIVIYDNESGLIIDSASFDTYQDSRPGIHRWWENFTALRAYEQEYCFK